MGVKLSKEASLGLRLSVASTVAVCAAGYALLQKRRADGLQESLESRNLSETPTLPSKIKLIYFDFEGRGECIRLALFKAGIPFEDVRVSKADGTFQALKPTLTFGQIPCLEVSYGKETFQLVQTAAILRYVAKLARYSPNPCNLYPEDPSAAALTDSIMDQQADTFAGLLVAKYPSRFGFYPEFMSESIQEQATAIQNKDIIPRHLEKLDFILQQSSTGWLANTEEPSIADFIWVPFFNSISNLEKPFTGDSSLLCEFPRLQDLQKRFMSQNFVCDWISHRIEIMNSA